MPDKSPAFQFYPRDFLADSKVILMSLTAVGVYIKLLCLCWMDGNIPADPVTIRLLTGWRTEGEPCATWDQVWAEVAPCFVRQGDHYLQPRVEVERQKQTAFRERQRRRGQQSAAVRWGTKLLNPHDLNSNGPAITPPLQPTRNKPLQRPRLPAPSPPIVTAPHNSASASAIEDQERAAPNEAHARDLANRESAATPALALGPAGAASAEAQSDSASTLDQARSLSLPDLTVLRALVRELLTLGCPRELLADAMVELTTQRGVPVTSEAIRWVVDEVKAG